MLSSAIPPKFNIPFANSAVAPYIRTIPQPSQTAITPGAASLTDGFPPLTFQPIAGGGIPPAGQDFNGLMNQVTKWTQWQAAGAPVFFDATFAGQIGGYPRGATLISTALNYYWLSTIENNTNNPDSNPAGWVQVVPASPSNIAPLVDGTASIGTSLAFARADHVHPTDTSRAALSYVNSTFETIAAANSTFLPILNPVAQGDLDVSGSITARGALFIANSGNPTTGALFLGNTGNRSLTFDGSVYRMANSDLIVNGISIAQTANTANTANNSADIARTNASTANTNLAITNASLFGQGQSYTNVTSTRTLGTIYTNSTGRPILVSVYASSPSGINGLTAFVNGVAAASQAVSAGFADAIVTFVVPAGSNYRCGAGMNLSGWFELR